MSENRYFNYFTTIIFAAPSTYITKAFLGFVASINETYSAEKTCVSFDIEINILILTRSKTLLISIIAQGT